MQVFVKAVLSLVIIFAATGIARRFPSIGGLIAVMPLSIVLGSGFGAWLVAACVHQWLLK